MAKIKNIEGLSMMEIQSELSNGAKFVVFEYCISIILMSFKQGSNIYFIKAGDSTLKHSLPFSLTTLLLGWWGIPWGPIYSIGSIYTNLIGGKDVTQEVIGAINAGN